VINLQGFLFCHAELVEGEVKLKVRLESDLTNVLFNEEE